jgi:hypothetical protein
MGWGVPEAGRQCYNSPMNSDLSGTRTTRTTRPTRRPRPRAKMPFLVRTLCRGPTKKLCNCITFKILQVDFSPTFAPELSLSQASPGEVWCSAFSCFASLRYRECHFWSNCFKRKLKILVNALNIKTSRPKSATHLFQADIDFLTRCCKAWQLWGFHEANPGLRPRRDYGWKYDSCSLRPPSWKSQDQISRKWQRGITSERFLWSE